MAGEVKAGLLVCGQGPRPQGPLPTLHPTLFIPPLGPLCLPVPAVPSLEPATWRACVAVGQVAPAGPCGAWRSQLASWRLERPEGSTTLLVLLQRPGQWAGWALASWPPGPWQMSSVCKRETGRGGLGELETVRPLRTDLFIYSLIHRHLCTSSCWALCPALAHAGLGWIGRASGSTGRGPWA